MAVKTPIRYVFDGSGNITEFSEFQSADFIVPGGADIASSVGSVELTLVPDIGFELNDKALVAMQLQEIHSLAISDLYDYYDGFKDMENVIPFPVKPVTKH